MTSKGGAMKGLVEGKVALVTGGGAGIGRAICELLAEHGASVEVVELNPEYGRATVARIEKAGGKAKFYQCDVSKLNEIESTYKAVVKDFNQVDVLVNNCGVGFGGDILKTGEADWRRIMDINLDAMFRFCKLACQDMAARKDGAIVNVSSLGGIIGGPDGIAYCTSKFGVIGLTRSMAADYAKDNVRCNVVAPGFTWTEMAQAGFKTPADKANFEKCMPIGRFAEPREIAAGVLFLASDLATYCSGSVLAVDGGITGCFWPKGMQ